MSFLRLVLLLLAVLAPVGAARADEAVLARLKADLLAGPSATRVLTQWCGDLRLATPATIRAERDMGAQKPATRDVRALLGAGAYEPIRYRRVRLMCGAHVLSEADNWYRPSQLSPAMNAALEESDTPFGAVVQPLHFQRRTLDITANSDAATVLRVRAVLLAGAAPFSLVVENYRPVLVSPPAAPPAALTRP